MNSSSLSGLRRLTAFDYIALIGLGINMIVITVIVVNWLAH